VGIGESLLEVTSRLGNVEGRLELLQESIARIEARLLTVQLKVAAAGALAGLISAVIVKFLAH
jgi:uncharacterized small protein (DUF1192 family)